MTKDQEAAIRAWAQTGDILLAPAPRIRELVLLLLRENELLREVCNATSASDFNDDRYTDALDALDEHDRLMESKP